MTSRKATERGGTGRRALLCSSSGGAQVHTSEPAENGLSAPRERCTPRHITHSEVQTAVHKKEPMARDDLDLVMDKHHAVAPALVDYAEPWSAGRVLRILATNKAQTSTSYSLPQSSGALLERNMLVATSDTTIPVGLCNIDGCSAVLLRLLPCTGSGHRRSGSRAVGPRREHWQLGTLSPAWPRLWVTH